MRRPWARWRRPQGRIPGAPAARPRSLVLHLPAVGRLGFKEVSLGGFALALAAASFYGISRLPERGEEPEESLVMIEEVSPSPPVEVEEPPKPPPPPPEPVTRTPPPEEAPPPPVFGLQAEETSDAGDLAVAMGNTLTVKPDSLVAPPPPPLPPRPPAPVELDHAPGFLRQAMAEYPEWALDQGVEAVVLVWVVIDAEGKVTQTQLKRGAAKDFDKAALTAAQASLFQPLVRNGVKLPSRFVVTYDFRLES